MALQFNLSSTELIHAIDNLNIVFKLQNATSESQQRELVNALPAEIREKIFFNIWDQANQPPEANYGRNHAFDSLNQLKLATQSVVVECLKTTASCLQALPESQRDEIHFKIWSQAGEPPVANYGEQHLFDDPAKLHQIVHDVLKSQQTPSSSHSSSSPSLPAPISVTAPTSAPASSPSDQIRERANAQGWIIFYDIDADPLTCIFGNFHPCLVHYQGKLFGNAEAAFQCQKYIDQPQIAALFTVHTTGDQAVALSRQYPMTPLRLSQWDSQHSGNKLDVMMDVLRAKFDTNPSLKEMLMATGSAYLCEHLPDANRRDNFWSDGFNGTGPNELGKTLMRVRGENGGVGQISSPWGILNGPMNYSYSSSSSPSLTPPAFQPLNAAREICILPSCTRPRYEGHKFCSLTHAQLYNNSCDNCHERPKFVETSGRVHNYCGRSCAQLAQQKK